MLPKVGCWTSTRLELETRDWWMAPDNPTCNQLRELLKRRAFFFLHDIFKRVFGSPKIGSNNKRWKGIEYWMFHKKNDTITLWFVPQQPVWQSLTILLGHTAHQKTNHHHSEAIELIEDVEWETSVFVKTGIWFIFFGGWEVVLYMEGLHICAVVKIGELSWRYRIIHIDMKNNYIV